MSNLKKIRLFESEDLTANQDPTKVFDTEQYRQYTQ